MLPILFQLLCLLNFNKIKSSPFSTIFILLIYSVMTLDFCGQRPLQLVVAEGNNIFEVTETHIRGRRLPYLLVAGGHKSF